MKLGFKQRLFLYISIVFTVFTIGIIVFEHVQEKKIKTEALEDKLDVYAQLISAKLTSKNENAYLEAMKELDSLLPYSIRISLIDFKGIVLYDNSIIEVSRLQNHLNRPEIKEALLSGKGDDIRKSASNRHTYLYFAKKDKDKFIRVALPYDIQTRNFLEPDNLFLYVIIGVFVIIVLLINWVSNRFGKSIEQLHRFAFQKGGTENKDYEFPNDELGEIGKQIAKNYIDLKQTKNDIAAEREKLMQHVHNAKEGICFFSSKKEVEFSNSLFLNYINFITDELESNPYSFFTHSIFSKAHEFIQQQDTNFLEFLLHTQGKIFAVSILIFENKGFEVILNDITQEEKNRQLKQEITGNIAHELRTPVTSIQGYLETVLEQNLTEEQQRYFISKAFVQTKNLSNLIQDVSVIAKMEEVGAVFQKEAINLHQFITQIKEDYQFLLAENKSDFAFKIKEDSSIQGNRNLLYSIFKNLIDNSLRYAGQGSLIFLDQYKEDSDFYYFSYFDTGKGVLDEKHLTLLFERFYRISEGRTRDTGGSGLGLSIVKNAIAFHGGTITAKNRKEGGLEFLFELKK